MNRPGALRVTVLLFALAGAFGCRQQVAPQPKYTAVGYQTASDGFAVSGGHLRAHPGKPGVMFGTVTKPKSSTMLAYVILFKLPATTNEASLALEGGVQSTSTRGGDIKSICRINGKQVEASTRYELKADSSAVSKELLIVGGKEVDPAAGRLFVVDLATAPPTYQQKKIALPEEVPQLLETAEVERFADVLLKSLQEKAPELKDSLK